MQSLGPPTTIHSHLHAHHDTDSKGRRRVFWHTHAHTHAPAALRVDDRHLVARHDHPHDRAALDAPLLGRRRRAA